MLPGQFNPDIYHKIQLISRGNLQYTSIEVQYVLGKMHLVKNRNYA